MTKADNINLGDTINGKKVVGVKGIIHGKLFPNTSIVAKISLVGKRGGKFYGHVYRDGTIGTERGDYGYFEGEGVINGVA